MKELYKGLFVASSILLANPIEATADNTLPNNLSLHKEQTSQNINTLLPFLYEDNSDREVILLKDIYVRQLLEASNQKNQWNSIIGLAFTHFKHNEKEGVDSSGHHGVYIARNIPIFKYDISETEISFTCLYDKCANKNGVFNRRQLRSEAENIIDWNRGN